MDRRSFLRSAFIANNNTAQQNYSGQDAAMLITSTLNEWVPSTENPWDVSAAAHLYHRLGFGGTYSEISEALKGTPSDLIDKLMDDAIAAVKPPPPFESEEWYETGPYQGTDIEKIIKEDSLYHGAKFDIGLQWMMLMTQAEIMMREKLTLFWHNHFVTEAGYYPQNVYRHFNYLRRNAWGNFKQMVKDVTIMPAMLIYLDGWRSQKGMINENYARELMELFTMGRVDRYGKENYTQADVVAMSNSLTGWRYKLIEPYPEALTPYFAPYYYDFELKTSPFGAEPKLYGLTSSGDTRIEADVIDLMFEKRGNEIAWHIAKKIYNGFVYRGTLSAEAEALVEQLAELLVTGNWELKPVMMKLFKSEHFFDSTHRGADIKSPVEYVIGMFRAFDLQLPYVRAGSLQWYVVDNGQRLLNPPNVKGWVGYRTWLNSSSIAKRNSDIARDLIVGDGIAPRIVNHHTGFYFEGINFPDEDVIAWSKQFDGFADDLVLFVKNVAEFLCAISPDENMMVELLHRSGITKFYEWQTLAENQKLPYIRRIVYNITTLAEFQLQ